MKLGWSRLPGLPCFGKRSPSRVCTVTLATLVFFVALIPRVYYLTHHEPELSPDERSYLSLAQTVRSSGTLGLEAGTPTAFRPPLYPLLLALFGGSLSRPPFGVLLAQVVASALTAVLSGWVALRLGGLVAGILAGLFAATYVPMMKFPAGYLTETLGVALFVVALLTFDRALLRDRTRDHVLTGFVLALAALNRVITLPLVAVPMVLVALRPGSSWRRRLSSVAWILGAFLLCYSPWVVRNCVSLDRCLVATAQGPEVSRAAYYTAELVDRGYTLRDARRIVVYGDQSELRELFPEHLLGEQVLKREDVRWQVRLRHFAQRLGIMLGVHPSLEIPIPFAGHRVSRLAPLRWFNYAWSALLLSGVALCLVFAISRWSLRLLHVVALPASLVFVYALVHAIPRYQCLSFSAWTVAAGAGWALLFYRSFPSVGSGAITTPPAESSDV